MKLNALTSLAQVAAFLAGTQPVTFSVLSTKDDCYHWIQANLLRFEYLTLSKPDKGLVCRYLEKVSGYSRQHLTRRVAEIDSPRPDNGRSAAISPSDGGELPPGARRHLYGRCRGANPGGGMSITAVHDGYLSRAAAPTPATRRQRRHCARRKQDLFVVQVEVTCEMITALVDQGDVDEADSSDLDRVGEAIAAAARRGLDLT